MHKHIPISSGRSEAGICWATRPVAAAVTWYLKKNPDHFVTMRRLVLKIYAS